MNPNSHSAESAMIMEILDKVKYSADTDIYGYEISVGEIRVLCDIALKSRQQQFGPEERSTVAPNVDGQNFYELCQQYRWAKEMMPHGLPNVVQAFDNLREYIKTGKLPWPSFEGDAPDAHP